VYEVHNEANEIIAFLDGPHGFKAAKHDLENEGFTISKIRNKHHSVSIVGLDISKNSACSSRGSCVPDKLFPEEEEDEEEVEVEVEVDEEEASDTRDFANRYIRRNMSTCDVSRCMLDMRMVARKEGEEEDEEKEKNEDEEDDPDEDCERLPGLENFEKSELVAEDDGPSSSHTSSSSTSSSSSSSPIGDSLFGCFINRKTRVDCNLEFRALTFRFWHLSCVQNSNLNPKAAHAMQSTVAEVHQRCVQ
jgi:hypothetical protein